MTLQEINSGILSVIYYMILLLNRESVINLSLSSLIQVHYKYKVLTISYYIIYNNNASIDICNNINYVNKLLIVGSFCNVVAVVFVNVLAISA